MSNIYRVTRIEDAKGRPVLRDGMIQYEVSMDNGEPVIYVCVMPPYQEDISSLLNLAKGSRTLAQFATDCGVTPPVFTNIISMKKSMVRPLKATLMENILNHNQSAQVSCVALMKANGFITLDKYLGQKERREKREMERETKENLIESLKNAVISKYYDRKLTVRPFREDEKAVFNIQNIPLYESFRYGIFDGNGDRILFQLSRDNDSLDRIEPEREFFNESTPLSKIMDFILREILYTIENYLLIDAWKPEVIGNDKLCIVITEPELYEYIINAMADIRVNSYISLLLIAVDDNGVRIVSEQPLRNRGDEAFEPVIGGNQSQ
ncbi:hypothetical protein SAMN02910456_02396 [Ruminococcaceae bacterium YRB3002]|nr:hypothetical protein SAMN02910456_02396 [Ruminococcaceae bacterium YRB3002]